MILIAFLALIPKRMYCIFSTLNFFSRKSELIQHKDYDCTTKITLALFLCLQTCFYIDVLLTTA